MTARGLTWDHPRGRRALEEAARRAGAGRAEPLLSWDVQPLEGFESAPIAELAARYDILVLDHPHIGEAVAEGCLCPLDAHFPAETLAQWERQTIGPAFRSYRWEGRPWAIPLDVATQVMARRPDMLATPPESWEAGLDIARHRPVAQSLAGPHAILTLMSMVAGQGGAVGKARFLDPTTAAAMLEVMHRLYGLRPAGSEASNPIGLLRAMATGEEIALIPLVFGYVNYARAETGTAALAFSDTIRAEGGRGGALGGTGIALTAGASLGAEVLGHLAGLMEPAAQAGFIPDHDGQPSARTAWADRRVNDAWCGFYRNTFATAEAALLRPRFDGYVAFQTAASARLRAALEAGAAPETTLDEIETLWARAREASRGPLDDKES